MHRTVRLYNVLPAERLQTNHMTRLRSASGHVCRFVYLRACTLHPHSQLRGVGDWIKDGRLVLHGCALLRILSSSLVCRDFLEVGMSHHRSTGWRWGYGLGTAGESEPALCCVTLTQEHGATSASCSQSWPAGKPASPLLPSAIVVNSPRAQVAAA